MTNLFASCSYMCTVKHRLWLMNCQRNRISFVSLEVRVSLLWRVLLVWLWRKHRLCRLQSPWTSHLGLSYRFLVSFVRVVPHRCKLLPSYFFLRVLPMWHMMSVYFYPVICFCTHHSFSVTPSFPWFSPFFILLKINPQVLTMIDEEGRVVGSEGA